MRANPETHVLLWLDQQPADALWVRAVTQAEISSGLAAAAQQSVGPYTIGLYDSFLKAIVEPCAGTQCTLGQIFAAWLVLRMGCTSSW